MPKAGHKQKLADTSSIADQTQLEALLKQAEAELEALQPQIDELENHLEKLKELKQQKQKLITLKLSLKSILNNFCNQPEDFTATTVTNTARIATNVRDLLAGNAATSNRYFSGTFLPDVAFEKAARILKKKNSLNTEFFRAIVFNGGQATTEDIRRYLIENRIIMPGTGQFFDNVPLTEISSRVNYLIRKGLVASSGRGAFISTLGWDNNG